MARRLLLLSLTGLGLFLLLGLMVVHQEAKPAPPRPYPREAILCPPRRAEGTSRPPSPLLIRKEELVRPTGARPIRDVKGPPTLKTRYYRSAYEAFALSDSGG